MEQLDLDFDASTFDRDYLARSEASFARAGFPTRGFENHPTGKRARAARLTHKGYVAAGLVTDIQQWLVDDDREVRELARATVVDLLRALVRGDENDTTPTPPERGTAAVLIDRWLAVCSASAPDSREPWWREKRQQRVLRWTLNAVLLSLGALTGLAVATANPLVALCCLLLTIIVDIVEATYTRVVRNRDVDQRWLACVARQVSDTFMLTGIAVALALATRPLVAGGVVTAVLIAVTGSFVRVSAVQAGHRIWLRTRIRLVRWAVVAAFCLSLLFVADQLYIAVLAAVSVGLTGIWEGVGAVVRVVKSEEPKGAAVVVLDADDNIRPIPVRGCAPQQLSFPAR